MERILRIWVVVLLWIAASPGIFGNTYSEFVIVQQKEITGKVVDENGEALLGVNVFISGTTTGTITNQDGNFTLTVPDGAESITFRYVGYTEQVVPIGNENYLNIVMVPNLTELEEIVVTGYGQTQNEKLVSSSITMVKPAKVIQDRPITRIEQSIQGATPAVVVIKESGSPGAPLTIRMRGVGTAGDATPLILLDGFHIPDMSFLNPNDIGGIGIYKDAAASAIYGARGGNGVLNVQSKSGPSKEGIAVDFSTYFGMQSLASEGSYLNAREYAEYYNNSINWLIRQGESIQGKGRGTFTDEELAALPNTSWIDAVTDPAMIYDLHLGISGRKGNSSVYFGAGLFDQGGIIESTGYNRKSTLLKVNTGLGERINLSVLGSYTHNTRDFIAENSENSRLLSSVASIPAIYPVYAESGSPFNNGLQGDISFNGVPLNSLAEFGNPIVGLTHQFNQSNADIFFGNALLNLKIFDGLKFNTSFGYLSRNNHIKQFGQYFEYPDQQFRSNPPENNLSENDIEESYWQWEAYFSYDKSFGGHNISAVLGTSVLYNDFLQTGRFGRDFTENTFEEVSFDNIVNDSAIVDYQDQYLESTIVSYYARLNYNFREKYLLGLTFRADASSKFGQENKWGYFPSINGGWVISNEEFMDNVEAISLLKIRASWGVNGNDRIPSYQYFQRYNITGSGALTIAPYDPNIKWEEITQANIGLDMDLLRNKIGISLDYYQKITEDMLIPFPNPSYTGLPTPWRNAATVKNTGLETFLTYRDKIGDHFRFDITANLGINRNELTELNGGLPLYGASTRVFKGAPYLTKSDIGSPIASFYGFVFEGLDEKGDPIYADLSGPDGVPDGEISPDYDRMTIGNPYPDLTYGLNITMYYRGFDFTVFATGIQGNDVVNASTGYGFQYSNRTDRVLDAWTAENPNSQVMRPSALDVINHEFSDYYLEDGSYMRVKNFTLGYSFPVKITRKLRMTKLRLYVSANNFFTFTNYSGYDPEIGANNDPKDVGIDRGFYPQAKSILGGIQVSF